MWITSDYDDKRKCVAMNYECDEIKREREIHNTEKSSFLKNGKMYLYYWFTIIILH